MSKTSFPAGKSTTMMACQTLAANFKDNIEELALVRDNWTPEYAADMETRLKEAIGKYIGVDNMSGLKKATNALNIVINQAKKDVNFFYKQVNADFDAEPLRQRRDAILQTLGFNTYWKNVSNTGQTDMINLLQTYKQNLTDELKQEINSKGTTMALLERIPTYLEQLQAANNTQEQLKSTTPELTEEANNVLNSLYQEVIAMAKIAKAYYDSDPVKRNQFTIHYIIRNLH